MKKATIISFGVLGFALSLGVASAFAMTSKEVKQVSAAEDGAIVIGTTNLFDNPTAFGDKVSLVSTSSAHTLTLTNFTHEITSGVANIIAQNITKPLTIKVKGSCSLKNSTASAANAYGIYVVSSTSAINLSIDGELSGSLSIQTANATTYSTAIMNYGSTVATVNISNVNVTATVGTAKHSMGFDFDNCNLNVSNSTINITTGGSNTASGQSTGMVAEKYTQTGGVVKTTAGNNTQASRSYGLRTLTGNVNISNGRLEAKGGNTVNKSSSGIDITGGSLILGNNAEVVAGAGKITSREEGERSYGVHLHTLDGTTVTFGENANYLYAYTAHNTEHTYARGINTNIVSSYPFFASNSNVFTDDNRTKIDAGSHEHVDYYQVAFQRVQYSATAGTTVTYDGSAHSALSLTVTYPSSATREYREKGTTTWSTTVPSYTDANESGYEVEYRISKTNFVPVIGEIKFYINKANSSLTTAPTKVDDFVYDGDAHELVNAGTVDGGTLMYSLDGGEYVTSLPSQTNAGSYEVSYKVVGDDNHKDIDPVSLGTVVISKADSVVTSAPEKVADFTADGESHALLTEGTVTGGTLKYSVNGGEFSATVPTAKDAGTYEISYRVDGDENHNDIAAVSLGSVTISVAPTPTPDPDTPDDPSDPVGPVNPSKNTGLPVWAIALIVVGGVLLLLCLLYILFMFVFNKWCIKDNKVVRAIKLREKQSRVKVILFPLCFTSRLDTAVFSSKAEAEKFLGK